MNVRKIHWLYRGKKALAWGLDCRVDGARIQKQFKSKALAERAYQKLIQGTDLSPGRLPDISFSDFVKVYGEKKPWRTESYKTRVLSALALFPHQERSLSRVLLGEVEEWRDSRLTSKSASTVRQDVAALKDCLKWAVKLGYLRRNPAASVERPSLPIKQDDPAAYIPQDDFYDKLLPLAGPKDGPLWRFMAWSGLRITEALSLEPADVNLKENYVTVRRGKGRKQRIVPLLPEAKQALQAAPRSTLRPSKVFGYASDRHACLRRFQRRCTKAGIGPYRIHDLRHSFGSWAAMAGVDLEVIAACMGHTSTVVTKQYAHLHPDYKRAEIMKMDRTRGEVLRKA